MIARRIVITVLALVFGDAAAFAQGWFVAPFVGTTFQAQTGIVDLEGAANSPQPAIGAAVGRSLAGPLGLEGDIRF